MEHVSNSPALNSRGKAQNARVRPMQKRQGPLDFALLITVVIICAFGLVMVFSASYYYAQSRNMDNGFYYLKNQSMYFAIGFALMLALSFFDYHVIEKLKTPMLILIIVLMLAVVFWGVERNGAKRWLDFTRLGIPLSFQPSEMAKFVLVLYMASFMSKRPQLMASFSHGIMPMLIIMGVFGILLLAQKNMSMMVIMVMTGAVMLFFGGARMAHLVTLAGIATPVMVIAVLSEEYRKARMTMFWDPWTSKAEGAYQLRQSLIALGSGGIFGKGLNFSRQKLLFLPYGESDFIFAIIGEELGLIGCVLLMGAYAFLVYRGIRIAMRCKDRFGSLLAAGITSVIGMQAIVNIAVATSSAPTTGQTLPFISAGGTSLVIFLSAAGILLNVSRNTQ